jgi:uncharacterized protein
MRPPSTAAGRGIVVLFLALVVGAILDADGLRKRAESQPQGFERRVAIGVTRPLARFSRALRLTAPRHALQVAIGREHEDDIDSAVHFAPQPRAWPHRRPDVSRRPTTHQLALVEPKPPPTDRKPLRVWVAGDSLAQAPGDALRRERDNLRVIGVESRLSTGLARPDLYNWYTRFEAVIAQLKPEVVVLSFGADDAHDFMTGVPRGHSIGPFGSPSWIAEYRRRVVGVTREFNAAGIKTVWLGLPIPDGPGFRRSFPVMNEIMRSVAKRHAAMSQYVDTWHMLASAHGKYTPYLRVNGKLTLMRLRDGVHYTAAAGDLVAARIEALIRPRERTP